MQIVIEISDTLKNIVDTGDAKTFSHLMWRAIVMDAIKNGTPSPLPSPCYPARPLTLI